MVADHLGTPRMVADLSGSLAGIRRHDYLPFGEEIGAGTGGRTTSQGYSLSNNVRQKFTKYERDTETGLDYAKARYHASVQGRFTSPDPLLASGKALQPQSWNRYTYTINNPLKYTDPSGLAWGYQQIGRNKFRVKWFDGKGVGKGFTKLSFSGVSKDIQLTDGKIATLYKNGYSQITYAPPPQGGASNAGNVNVAAGMADGFIPGFKQARQALGVTVDENSGEYQKANAIGSGTQLGASIVSGGVALSGVRGAASLADDAASGGTTLYRAVTQTELDDILATGTYRLGSGSTEVKYFFEYAEDAAAFAKKMFSSFPKEGPYTVTSTVVDDAVIRASSNLSIAGEGSAVIVPRSQLPLGPVKVWDWAPLP